MTRIAFILFLVGTFSFAQPNTEVYLMDLNFGNDTFELSNFRNISNDDGYDSQPSFQSDNLLIFAGNNGGQTDIAQYNIRFDKKFWYHEGSASSQYSPQRIPNSENVLSVHLDSTGYQRLFHHHITLGDYKEAHPDLRVAYFSMYNEDLLLGSVLGDDGLDLVVANLETKVVDTLAYNAGRSFHRVPNSESMSYTYVNEEGNHDVYQLDMGSFESFFVVQLPIDVQDHVWLNDTTCLIGSGTKLFMYDLFGEDRWMEVADLSEFKIDNITRMALSPDGTKLAIVAVPTTTSEK
ncbi:hypothetical protein J1N09_07830 [Aureitalea sp. L0-47]|uniref:hypothetical protein n=1 Tax=Aureitalea sp. L0-47 TaxID=2816962 RepID=UPI002237DA42|nr:hypothetical protein [Aureitalea sp. L0-47]MCW5519744.1 hypothetical protein [Aureitalea sp. L0-47]